jgi:hypothetical protein
MVRAGAIVEQETGSQLELEMLMRLTRGSMIQVCAAAGLLAVAAAQTPSKMQFTARELFYAAAQAPKQAPAPAKNTPPSPVKKKAAGSVSDVAKSLPPIPDPPRPVNTGSTSTTGAKVIPAVATAPAPTSGPALGLRYNILKLTGGQMTEVPPDTVFHAGDRIQFSVQTNGPGYLYIVSQGTSGTWKPMFPAPELEDGNNRVDGWVTYTMPPKAQLVFDQQTGSEKVFIVFAREPEPDLEKMIYTLQGKKPASVSEPAAPKQLVTFASLNINDATVGRLRNVYSRDLIIEKVTPQTPGERKETAVYVVNPTGSNESCLVADLSLVHQ